MTNETTARAHYKPPPRPLIRNSLTTGHIPQC